MWEQRLSFFLGTLLIYQSKGCYPTQPSVDIWIILQYPDKGVKGQDDFVLIGSRKPWMEHICLSELGTHVDVLL